MFFSCLLFINILSISSQLMSLRYCYFFLYSMKLKLKFVLIKTSCGNWRNNEIKLYRCDFWDLRFLLWVWRLKCRLFWYFDSNFFDLLARGSFNCWNDKIIKKSATISRTSYTYHLPSISKLPALAKKSLIFSRMRNSNIY